MKKAMAMGMLAGIILSLASFLVLLGVLTGFFTEADPIVVEQTCRSSVMLRSIQKGLSEATFGGAPELPLACQTQHFTLPLTPIASKNEQIQKNAVQKDIGDLMTRCWRMFGNGMVQNPFLQSQFTNDRCFVCFGFTIDDDAVPNGKPIEPAAFRDYIFSQAYDVQVKNPCYRGGGTCVANEGDCKGNLKANKLSSPCAEGKDICCSSSNECENKGGECLALEGVSQTSDSIFYADFSCGGKGRCFVPKDNVLTYADYIQFADGKGAIAIPTTGFGNEKQYGVMYLGSHETCGATCMLAWGGATVVGAAFGVVTGGVGPIAVLTLLGAGAGGLAADMYLQDKPAPQAIFVGELDEIVKRCPGGLTEGFNV